MLNKSLITVVGSSNMDLVVKISRFPTKGETICGGNFFMNPGGKGANQAVAARRMEAKVYFVSRIGKDVFGDEILSNLEKKGIRTECLIKDEKSSSGIAIIMVDKKGGNIIAVASGANSNLFPADIDKCKSSILSCKLLLLQLEIPLATAKHAIDLAYENKISVILNPVPAARLDNDLLGKIDIIVPNQKEAQLLTGMEIKNLASAERAGKNLLDRE